MTIDLLEVRPITFYTYLNIKKLSGLKIHDLQTKKMKK